MKEVGRALYYIRFRYIPFELMFTPLSYITIDHIQVESFVGSTEWDLKVAICRELNELGYKPDEIRIESSQSKLLK